MSNLVRGLEFYIFDTTLKSLELLFIVQVRAKLPPCAAVAHAS
jgi:hypothetical protein